MQPTPLDGREITNPTAGPTNYYINSWSARTGQRIGARIIDSMIALGCITLVVVAGPHGRPLGQDLLIIALVAGIEAFTINRTGATAGMRVFDIRVAPVGDGGHPSLLAASRRSFCVALCYAVLLPGVLVAIPMPLVLLASIGLSPSRRGFHDRLSNTVVVQADAPPRITVADMASWWQPDQNIVMCPWGRVPGVFDRRRSRAHRIDGAWWLAGTIMTAGIVMAAIGASLTTWLWMTVAWLVLVTADESWCLTTTGATPGHRHFGYRVVDIATGEPPTRLRAIVRSAILAPLLYIPPLQLVGALWVHVSRLHRGPHDLVARTIVVEPGYRPAAFLVAPPQVPVPYGSTVRVPLPPPPVDAGMSSTDRLPVPGPF